MFDVAFTLIAPAAADPLPVLDDGGVALEDRLITEAIFGRPCAALWTAPAGLIVPRSYRRFDRFESARAESAARGTPVWLRPSGGGIVPQGPGIVNLSLAFATMAAPDGLGRAVYDGLCDLLGAALAGFGIDAEPREVSGSFCDGRFNLAVAGRKIAGTAQYWKHLGPGRRAVLAHALLIVDADADEITSRVNAFERAIDSGTVHDPATITSVARCLAGRGTDLAPAARLALVREALVRAIDAH